MSKSSLNKINKYVLKKNPEWKDVWNADEFQQGLKKCIKSSKTVVGEKNPKEKTPYIKFCVSEHSEIRKQHPDYPATKITELLGKRWQQLKIEAPEYLASNYGYDPAKDLKNKSIKQRVDVAPR